MGDKVNKPGTSQKSYWKIINRIMNKCRAPKIPPLFINNQFILDCKEKATIFKKGNKQLIKNYRPISLLPICGKLFEKIIFNCLYSYLNQNSLLTRNQSGFRPGDSTTNQLLYLVNEIHLAFENPKSLEVRAIFLDISKAFDEVWHAGFIFKLEQNDVCGNLLKFFQNYLTNR